MSQLWEKLLYITGGRLELSKCYWIPISWKWSKGKATLVTKPPRQKELFLTESETGELIMIPRKTGHAAEKRLGIISTCNSSWTAEFKHWISYSTEFGDRLIRSRLGWRAGYLAYHSIWLAKFRYSAPSVGFTPNQLNKIQQKIIGPCLSVGGYCNRLPRAVVFGTNEYGGLNWTNLKVVFLYEKLKMLIGSIRLNDKIGQMIRYQLTWLQLVAGVSTPLLRLKITIPYVPEGWLQNLHVHFVENGIQVDVGQLWTPTKQREKDQVIMDLATKHIPPWTWGGINRCRLFLRATTVTDLTTLDGTYIPDKIRTVRSRLRDNRLDFPIQARPSTEDIKYWQYLIDYISENGHLHTKLGSWKRFPDQHFPYMYSQDTSVVYKFQKTSWEVFGNPSTTRRRFRKLNIRVYEPCRGSVPARVIDGNHYLIPIDTHVSSQEEIQQLEATSFRQDPQNDLKVLGKYALDTTQMNKLATQWNTKGCTIVCAADGGLKEDRGTSSYLMCFPQDYQPILEGYSGEIQHRKSASITRQELLGQLGLELWLEKFTAKWGIPQFPITVIIITDSQSSIEVVNNSTTFQSIKDTLGGDMDMGMVVGAKRKAMPWFQRRIVKITSHTDVTAADDEFHWHCNDRADTLATQARQDFDTIINAKQEYKLFPATRAGCLINGHTVNNDVFAALQDHLMGSTMREFLITKHGWTRDIFHQIAWIEHQKELQQFPPMQKITLMKYIHGWLATKRRRFREGLDLDARCPLCGEEETKYHFLTCTNERLSQIREKQWQQYTSEINKITPDGCKQVFLVGLNTVNGQATPTRETIHDWPSELQDAFSSQENIGWEQVLVGRVAKCWGQVVKDMSYNPTDATQSQWIRQVIRRSWRYGLDVWKARNELVHGNDGGPSKLEVKNTLEIVRAMYSYLYSIPDSHKSEILPLDEAEMLQQPYQVQIAWLGRIKHVYPEDYSDIVTATLGKVRTEAATELSCLRATGLKTFAGP